MRSAGTDVVDARVMLIAQFEREVTIARDGRILIKSRDATEAQRIFELVRPMLGVPPDRDGASSPTDKGYPATPPSTVS